LWCSKKGRKRQLDEEQKGMQELLRTVLRFNHTTTKLGEATMGTTIDLAGLKQCSSLLIYEMGIECLATGLTVHVEVPPPPPLSSRKTVLPAYVRVRQRVP